MSNKPTKIREDEKHEHTDEKETEESLEVCPECSGEIIQDNNELICEDCGLVIEDETIDHGPEWRAFDSSERSQKSRVGSPVTESRHDKGLSTNISWQDKDAYGNTLSATQRSKMKRLRKWDERFRTKDSSERNMKQAFGEISRMSSSLGFSKAVQETASVIYRRAQEEGLVVGRSIEGVATASLYAASRKLKSPRTPETIAQTSRVDLQEINRTYMYLTRELGLEIEPSDPREYLNKFLNDLIEETDTLMNQKDKANIRRTAEEIIDTAEEANLHSGRAPTGLAASAIYAAGLIESQRFTQREVASVTNVTEVTIRNRYQEMIKEHIGIDAS